MRFSVTSAARPVNADPVPKKVREIMAIPAERRTTAERAAVFSYYRTTLPEFAAANAKIDNLMKGWPDGATTLTLVARDDLRETHILKRGDSFKPDRAVTPECRRFCINCRRTRRRRG